MRMIQYALLFMVISLGFMVFAPAEASAWNPFGSVDCSGQAAQSAVCSDTNNGSPVNKNPITGTNGLIMKVVNILSFIAGAAAVVIIILAGLRFVTAGGSSEDVNGARRTLIYAVVGLIIIAIARTLVAFVLGRI